MSARTKHRTRDGAASDARISSLTGPAAAAPVATLRSGLVAGAIVFILTAAVFLPVLRNGFVEWDDPFTIVDNAHIRALGGEQLRWMFTTFYWGHYQPLLWLSYALDYAWASVVLGDGLAPAAYHATSLLLHAVATLLVFFLARRLQAATCSGPCAHRVASMTLPAVGAALLFGLHPLRVEPVAWATGRGDVLATVFLLTSVLAYLHAVERPKAASRARWLVVAIAAQTLSLLCRAMGVTLPLVLVLLDWYPLRRLGGGQGRWFGRTARPVWAEKLPFIVLSAAAAIVAPLAKAEAHATVELAQHGVIERLAQACYGLMFYLWKTVLPAGLSPIYELRLPMDATAPRYAASMLIVLLGVIALLLIARRRSGLPCGLAAYVVLLLPVLGFVQSGNQLAADRYSYLPGVALAMLLAGGIRWLLTAGRPDAAPRAAPGRAALAVRLLPVAAAVIACAMLSVRQIGIWRSNESLWTYTAARALDSSIAQNGYGWVLVQAGRYDEALGYLRRAVELQPANEKAHHNIWMALSRQGRSDELLQAYRDSVRVFPNFVDARYNLGVELQRRGLFDEAMAAYRAALDLQPRHSQALTNVGQLLQQKGEVEEARRYYERAVEADGRNLVARRNLARLLWSQNLPAEAIAQLEAALRVAPDDPNTRQLLEEWQAMPR